MRESRTYGSVRGQCREALVYSTSFALIIEYRRIDTVVEPVGSTTSFYVVAS